MRIHATQSIANLLKMRCMNVAVCTAVIPENQRIRYQQYWDHNNAKSQGAKRGMAKIEEAIMDSQASALGISASDLTDEVPDCTSGTPYTIIVPASNKRGRLSFLPTIHLLIHPSKITTSRGASVVPTMQGWRCQLPISSIARTSPIGP